MDNTTNVAGIDIGKWELHVHVLPSGQELTVENDLDGVTALSEWLRRHDVRRVVMEATGRYHRRAHNRLMEEGIEVALINPWRARQFAQAAGKIAKTDSVDARTLARFGQVMEPEFVRPDSPKQVALKDLIMVRNKLVEHRKSLKIMVQECSHPEGSYVLNDTIADLHIRIFELEKMIRAQIRTSRELRRRDRILQSIPGIGPITSAVLCASMPELGAIGPRKAAALIGLAPFNADSGTHSGLRHIKGGRFIPRKALYMAATTAVQCNPDMKQTYQRLKAKGKKHKVALVTVMRKLVILAGSLLRADRLRTPTPPVHPTERCVKLPQAVATGL